MASEIFAKSGLFLDELNKIRVINPQVAQDSGDLRQECTDFLSKTSEFQKIVDNFIELIDELAGQVELEKSKAIGSRNLLQSLSKQKEAEQQQLQALIREKQIELERLRRQYESLSKIEAEQREFLQQN